MYQQKIGISIGGTFGLSLEEFLHLLKKTGFDAISPVWEGAEALKRTAQGAAQEGLELQSLHAPFQKAHRMWSRDEERSASVLQELMAVVDACAEHRIPVAVVHAWIGFDYVFDKEELYYGNFDALVDYARARGVTLALENTEGEEYLFALMERYRDCDTVGFCWDSGHELCYNHSRDLLGALGHRLVVTHLNDNLGISRFDGKIFWTDDLHLLPFDGIADWQDAVARLQKCPPLSVLNFELSAHSKPDRHENDGYARMSPEEYFAEAYKRACRIAYLYAQGRKQ